jgi:ubiquinone/menaquinone biosynthesis C-methylase UbiE
MGNRNHRETSLGGDWLRKLPHYLYVADLIAGKQVIEIGCGSGEGARFLADHGAARVVGVDARSGKVEQARRRYSAANLTFRHEDPASMELRDHSFDCVFVPDGAAAAKRPALLRELRRILAPGGHLILVSASADRDPEAPGLTFHELKDALEPLFAPVRMVAQSPMVAMSLVEYAEEESDNVAFDTSLVEWTHAPDGVVIDYMAICGGATDVARGFTLVQLPLGPGVQVVERSLGGNGHVAVGAGGEGEAGTVTGGVNGGALAGWSTGAGTVSAQIASALQEHAEMTRELERALAEQQLYSDELREELEQSLERSGEAEGARKALAEKLDAMQDELKTWRSRAAQAEGDVMRLRLGRGEAPQSGADGAPGESATAHERELASLRAELADARQRLERVAVHWKEAEAKNETIGRRVNELEAEAGRQSVQANARLAEARQQFDSELAEAVAQAAARAGAQAEEGARARQAATESELARLRSELEQLRPELAASEQRSQALSAELDRQRSEVDGLGRLAPELARLEAERDAQARRADAAEAARAELEHRLETAASGPAASEPGETAVPKRKPRTRKKASKVAAPAELPLAGLEATVDENPEPETPPHDADA